MKNKKYTCYVSSWTVQLRNPKDEIIAIFPTIGSGYAVPFTSSKEAERECRKIVKILNKHLTRLTSS